MGPKIEPPLPRTFIPSTHPNRVQCLPATISRTCASSTDQVFPLECRIMRSGRVSISQTYQDRFQKPEPIGRTKTRGRNGLYQSVPRSVINLGLKEMNTTTANPVPLAIQSTITP